MLNFKLMNTSNTKSNVYIGILDILGFKDLVQRNSHKELIYTYQELYVAISVIHDIQNRGAEALNKGEIIDFDNIKYNKIQSLTISDSIILWSEDDSLGSFLEMVRFVRLLLFLGIEIGIPFRGAISFGPISVLSEGTKRNASNFNITIVGKGLVDAYIFEMNQNWSGCIVDKRCIDYLNKQGARIKQKIDDFVANCNLIKYKVPLKVGQVKLEYAVNWIPDKYNSNYEKKIIASFSKKKKRVTDWQIEQKIKNTIDFYRAACLALNKNGFFLDLELTNFKVLKKEVKLILLEMLKTLAENDLLDDISSIGMGGYFSQNEDEYNTKTK
jgi:hypothetical protein